MMEFKCTQRSNSLYSLSGDIINKFTEKHEMRNTSRIISTDIAYNAGRIWIDFSKIPYNQHDSIFDTIEECTNIWITSDQSENVHHYDLYLGKFGFALNNIDIWFSHKTVDGNCIDEKSESSKFAMHALSIKKWLAINALGKPTVKLLPLNADMSYYGFLCKWKSENTFYQQHCAKSIKMQIDRYFKLFFEGYGKVKMTAAEKETSRDYFNQSTTEVKFCLAFESMPEDEMNIDNPSFRSVQMASLRDLGLIE